MTELKKNHIVLNEESEFTLEHDGHLYEAKVVFTDAEFKREAIELDSLVMRPYREFVPGEQTIDLKASIVGKLTRTTIPVNGTL